MDGLKLDTQILDIHSGTLDREPYPQSAIPYPQSSFSPLPNGSGIPNPQVLLCSTTVGYVASEFVGRNAQMEEG